jgi:hypothetical protein
MDDGRWASTVAPLEGLPNLEGDLKTSVVEPLGTISPTPTHQARVKHGCVPRRILSTYRTLCGFQYLNGTSKQYQHMIILFLKGQLLMFLLQICRQQQQPLFRPMLATYRP